MAKSGDIALLEDHATAEGLFIVRDGEIIITRSFDAFGTTADEFSGNKLEYLSNGHLLVGIHNSIDGHSYVLEYDSDYNPTRIWFTTYDGGAGRSMDDGSLVRRGSKIYDAAEQQVYPSLVSLFHILDVEGTIIQEDEIEVGFSTSLITDRLFGNAVSSSILYYVTSASTIDASDGQVHIRRFDYVNRVQLSPLVSYPQDGVYDRIVFERVRVLQGGNIVSKRDIESTDISNPDLNRYELFDPAGALLATHIVVPGITTAIYPDVRRRNSLWLGQSPFGGLGSEGVDRVNMLTGAYETIDLTGQFPASFSGASDIAVFVPGAGGQPFATVVGAT